MFCVPQGVEADSQWRWNIFSNSGVVVARGGDSANEMGGDARRLA